MKLIKKRFDRMFDDPIKQIDELVKQAKKLQPICPKCGERTITWFNQQVATGDHCSNCGWHQDIHT